MIHPNELFASSSESKLIELIRQARRRPVVVSPALTDRVTTALADRLDDVDRLAVTVIVDADPEVYRLGYGTETAFDLLRKASSDNMFDLRVQYGIRIGVIISDEITMTFSPIPLLIETGSTAAEKTNAIILSGAPTERIHQSAFLLVQWSQPKRILSKNSEPPFAGR